MDCPTFPQNQCKQGQSKHDEGTVGLYNFSLWSFPPLGSIYSQCWQAKCVSTPHTHTHQNNNNNNKTCTDRDFFSFFFFSFSIPMLKIISFSIMVCNICLYIFNFYLCISSTLIIQVKLSIPVTFSRIHASDYHVYDHAMSHPSPIPEKEKKKEKKNHNQQRCIWPGG